MYTPFTTLMISVQQLCARRESSFTQDIFASAQETEYEPEASIFAFKPLEPARPKGASKTQEMAFGNRCEEVARCFEKIGKLCPRVGDLRVVSLVFVLLMCRMRSTCELREK